MNLEAELETIGLTKNEVKVYLALSEIGMTTSSKIIKKVGINTSKVYESLERLVKKGLVSYTIIKNKKHWIAEKPQVILEYISEEQRQLEVKKANSEKVIEELSKIQNIKTIKSMYRIYEGIKGIKTVREKALELLTAKDTFYLIAVTYPDDKNLFAYFADFQKRRASKGIAYKAIFGDALKKGAANMKALPLSETKIMSTNILSPTWIEIYAEYVCIGIMGKNPAVIVIQNADIAKGYVQYFNTMWNMK